MMASPPILNLLENVTFPDRLAEMRAFFSGAAAKNPGFRVFIDSACALPSNWQDMWAAPKQWGVTGNQHWATKYGAQGFIPKMLANSPYATNDWRSASASVVVLFARHFGGGPAIVQQQCLQRLRERSAAFIATNGSRHFFIFTDSRGPCCLDGKYKDVDFIHHHIIGPHGEPPPQAGDAEEWFFRRGHSAPRIRCFDEHKDINIPTPNIHFPRTPFAPPLPADAELAGAAPRRSLLLFYAGWNYGTRMDLVRMYEQDAEVLVRRRVKKAEYQQHMRQARFCPICGGFSQWTPRLAEALHYGCVPVILSPRMLEPWANLLDWTTFSVRLPPTKQVLRSLKARLKALDYPRLARGVQAARAALRYHLDDYRGDDMLPLLLFEMARVVRRPISPPAGVSTISNDVDPQRDYNGGLVDVRSQRKAHWVETHAAITAGGATWDCASMDGYMCECKQRTDPRVASRARRCFVSAACYDTAPPRRGFARRQGATASSSAAAAESRRLAENGLPAVSETPLQIEAALGEAELLAETSCKATDRKTRSRQATCRSPEVVDARRRSGKSSPHPGVSVLFTRERLIGRSRFSNEDPFNVSHAFERYRTQLPDGPGSFSGSAAIRHHWPSACDSPKCPSCAAVGASGSLLGHTHGSIIDNHTVVLRANWLKLKGYEQHVGTRTTLNVIFALENMLDQFVRSQRKVPSARRAVGLATPSSKRGLNSYFRYLGRLKTNASHALHRPKPDDAPLLLLSDDLWLQATNYLCGATNMGCSWYAGASGTSRSSTMRPSSGFYAVLVALQICSSVSLFGLTSDPCAPFHYYGPKKKKGGCTLAVPKENDEHVHWFEKEHELYAQWQREGLLKIYS